MKNYKDERIVLRFSNGLGVGFGVWRLSLLCFFPVLSLCLCYAVPLYMWCVSLGSSCTFHIASVVVLVMCFSGAKPQTCRLWGASSSIEGKALQHVRRNGSTEMNKVHLRDIYGCAESPKKNVLYSDAILGLNICHGVDLYNE